MRIWHSELIPYLCKKHLIACWREGLGCLSILLHDKKGYSNHPQVKAYQFHMGKLGVHLDYIRNECIKRGIKARYVFKDNAEREKYYSLDDKYFSIYKEWQTLEQQLQVLKNKPCECYNNYMKGKKQS